MPTGLVSLCGGGLPGEGVRGPPICPASCACANRPVSSSEEPCGLAGVGLLPPSVGVGWGERTGVAVCASAWGSIASASSATARAVELSVHSLRQDSASGVQPVASGAWATSRSWSWYGSCTQAVRPWSSPMASSSVLGSTGRSLGELTVGLGSGGGRLAAFLSASCRRWDRQSPLPAGGCPALRCLTCGRGEAGGAATEVPEEPLPAFALAALGPPANAATAAAVCVPRAPSAAAAEVVTVSCRLWESTASLDGTALVCEGGLGCEGCCDAAFACSGVLPDLGTSSGGSGWGSEGGRFSSRSEPVLAAASRPRGRGGWDLASVLVVWARVEGLPPCAWGGAPPPGAA